jgi:hypothetical protein
MVGIIFDPNYTRYPRRQLNSCRLAAMINAM